LKAGGSSDAALSGALTIALLGAAVASMMIGPAGLGPAEILQGLLDGSGVQGLIIREIRLPRLILTLSVGFTLGLSGAVLQGLLRNPLAEPAVFGAPQAAALGAAILLNTGTADALSWGQQLAAMTGAMASIALVWLVAGRARNLVSLLLAGLAVASLAGAGTALTINLSPNPFAVMEIVFWLMGSFEDRSMRHVMISVPFMVMACLILLRMGRGLRALTLGEDVAVSLGINLAALRFIIVLAVAMGVGAGVAVSGAISFVGLIAPHLVRSFVKGDPARLLLPSALSGALLLLLSDMAVRLLPSATELKVGVLTVCLGVPFFLWLIASGRMRFGAQT
jgi:iron complex transport system permease protein